MTFPSCALPVLSPRTRQPLLKLVVLVFAHVLLSSGAQLIQAQTLPGNSPATLSGSLLDAEGEALSFANVILYAAADSTITKVEVSDEEGAFSMSGISAGSYFLTVKYIGLPDLSLDPFELGFGESRNIGQLSLKPAGVALAEATVTAQRAIVEIKADRTVFNVEGTVNSAGGDGMSLLRKAPGVVVDNNNNIIVLGRQGVLVYIDGKRSPLAGEALTSYLQSLPAEQIDRIDIITNPGAKYEAEGNAGIIDIRLKKNENWGSNGSVSSTASQGEYFRSNLSATLNHRQGRWNSFATGGVYQGKNYNNNFFNRTQNDLFINETDESTHSWAGGNLKIGTDYRVTDKHTVGVLANLNYNDNSGRGNNRAAFGQQAQPGMIDSILVSRSIRDGHSLNATGNFNYRFDNAKGTTLNVDFDYGAYRSDSDRRLPNQFFGPDGATPRSSVEFAFETPTDIDIYTTTLDYEQPLGGGKLGAGAKLTKVISDNTFRFYQMLGGERQLNAVRSNLFVYDEQVEAAYLNFLRDFGPAAPGGQGKAFSFTSGLRVEHTRALGDLTVLDGSPMTSPVDRNYLNFFPNLGLTWAAAPKHTLALSYGRRINRPDYENLNPFFSFASLVTFEQGNPTLRPEIVNNLELAHTFAYRYTTKLSYSRTEDQITRLIRKSDQDERGQYISYDNLANQTVLSLNVSVPAQLNKWWEVYFTATGSYINNQASYPDGATVDLQAFNYNMYAQNTWSVGGGWKAELSGWFSGPGIWGGTFETEAQGAVNIGAQRKFLNEKLRFRIALDDIFYTSGWNGRSEFDGQVFVGGGNWDSRRLTLSLTYNFGNEKVRVQQRKTGLDDAASRVGS